MADPIEAVDDQSPYVDLTKTTYSVFHRPYLPGTVHVYVNGLLQDDSWVTELDPVAGTIELAEPVLERAEDDHSLHIAYLTYAELYVDPEAPIHITQLAPGDVVRIAMKAGWHLKPTVVARWQEPQLVPMEKRRVARGADRTVFFCYITTNDRTNGVLYGQVEDRGAPRTHLSATVPYSAIKVIERYVTPGHLSNATVTVGGGPGAIRRPGIFGRNFQAPTGARKLIRVKF